MTASCQILFTSSFTSDTPIEVIKFEIMMSLNETKETKINDTCKLVSCNCRDYVGVTLIGVILIVTII